MPDLNLNQQHAREHSLELTQSLRNLAENLIHVAATIEDLGNVDEEMMDEIADASNEMRRMKEHARLVWRREWLCLATTRRVAREARENLEAIRQACQAEEARLTEARSRSRQVADRITRQREEAA